MGGEVKEGGSSEVPCSLQLHTGHSSDQPHALRAFRKAQKMGHLDVNSPWAGWGPEFSSPIWAPGKNNDFTNNPTKGIFVLIIIISKLPGGRKPSLMGVRVSALFRPPSCVPLSPTPTLC